MQKKIESYAYAPFHIAAESVLQLIKMSLIQCRSCTTGKSGPGGI
jgi:hypothetical protein